jgi:hypothetical protein
VGSIASVAERAAIPGGRRAARTRVLCALTKTRLRSRYVHSGPRVYMSKRQSGSIRGDVKRKSSRIELKPGEKFIWHPAPARSSCRGAWPKMRPAGNSSVGRVCSHRGQRDCRLPTVGTRARQVVGRRTCSGRRRRFLVSCFPSCLGESCFRTARSGQGRAGRRGGAGP